MRNRSPTKSPPAVACAVALAVATLGVPLASAQSTQPGGIPAGIPTAATEPAASDHIVAPTDPNVYLTADQLAQAFREKQYTLVLHEVFRIQGSKKAAADYTPYDLYILRGESLLHLRNVQPALEAYKDAVKAAPDDDSKVVAQATQLLIQRQTNLKYIPTTPETPTTQPRPGTIPPKPPPIDLLDMSQRTAAFRALFRDETVAAMPALKAALAGDKLAPIAAASKSLLDLSTLEAAAEGKPFTVEKMQKQLAERARDLMIKALKMSVMTATEVRTRANILEQYNAPILDLSGRVIGQELRYRKHGLDDNDAQTLKGIISDTAKYQEAAKELAERLQQDSAVFSGALDDSKKVDDLARDVLTTDYSGTDSDLQHLNGNNNLNNLPPAVPTPPVVKK